jgi:undecaprenyl-diphosphatase
MDLWFVALIQGVVEGITEYLPISSTGYLIVTAHFLGFTGEVAHAFEAFIQLGAILTMVVLYRAKLWSVARH